MAICTVCGAEVEGPEHCGQPVKKDSDDGDSAPEGHSHNCC